MDNRQIEYQPIKYDNLYERYPTQYNHQSAYLEIDLTGDVVEVRFGINPDVGSSIPSRVWHGRAMRYEVSPCLNRRGQEEIYSDPEVIRLIGAIVAGYDCSWDGSNHQGCLNEDAQSASYDLSLVLQDGEWSCDDIWDARDWLGDMDLDDWRVEFGGDYSHAAIDRMVEAIYSGANADGITLVGDLRKLVAEKANELIIDK